MISLVRAVSATTLAGLLTALLMSTSGCRQPDDTDNVMPYIRISFPQAGVSVLDDIATIRAEARDNVGIKQVIFMAEGDTLALLTAEPYVLHWNTTAYPDCTDADPPVLLVATAEDFAGNSRSTHREFYLDNEGNPPIPVELFDPINVTKHSVTLFWEPSVDYYFSHYQLRRDVTSDVTGDSDSLVMINGPDTTSFTDQGKGVSPFGLLENTDYYYRIWVYDVFDSSSVSDSVVTSRTLLPQPVILSATATLTKYTAGLKWEPSTEDVAYYRLHRGPSPLKANLDSIARFPEDTHSYVDAGRTAKTTYYYYLYLIDDAGYTHAFRSDDVLEVRTLALPPVLEDPPRVVTKYSATIAWKTIAEQEDSSWVALYSSTATAVDSTDLLLYTAPRNEPENYTDSGLQQGGTYYYRLHHRDSQGNTAWSNTLALTTRTLTDVWSGGLGYSQGKYQLDLTWDRYSYTPTDFAGYTLSRDGQVIFTSTDAADNQYPDIGLAKNTSYSYRLVVADTSGASLAVTLDDAYTRDIYPAKIVTLEATDDWSYNLAWLPSQESDSEFDRYELLRSNDTEEIFEDNDGDNTADCLSGNCVQVTTFPQRTDTTYQDDDATLVATTERDTTIMDTTWVITTLMDTTRVDSTWMDSTWVDMMWVITQVETTWVDTTWVDTPLMVIIPVDTTVVDTTLPIFNYVVLTFDVAGEYVRSNIVGDTLKPPPTAVTLTILSPGSSETTIGLEWTRASWPNPVLEAVFFSRYEVWRNSVPRQQPGAAGSSYQLIANIADINVTSFSDDRNLGQGLEWFYVVVVRDIFGKGAVSNEEMGWTKP